MSLQKMNKIKEADIFLVVQCMFFLLALSYAKVPGRIGINYGRQGSDIPTPYQSVQILERMNIDFVKLPDSNHDILRQLSGTKIHVSITIPNDLIPQLASNETLVERWVQENVIAFYPDTMIRYIMVGNEVLSQENNRLWSQFLPVIRSVHDVVRAHNIENIKLSTTFGMDVLETVFPPSSGTFRTEIPHENVLIPLLKYLDGTNSFIFLNVYPYLAWSANPTNLSLDQALFRADQNASFLDQYSGLNYTNLLDQMLDSVIFASRKNGFENINIGISETGWPHAGDIDQPGANVYNAATYNRNLVRKLTTRSTLGTPARPRVFIPAFISSLFDENLREGPTSERSWGILHGSGLPIYEIDLTGNRPEVDYPELPAPLNNDPYRGNLWCVVSPSANYSELNQAMDSICRQGNRTCDAITPGKECYEPVSLVAHASYAFSSYWAQFRSQGAACYFNGLAAQTTRDLSHAGCTYPSVTV